MIDELIAGFDLPARRRVDAGDSWDEIVARLPYGPVFYSSPSIDYQLAYQRGTGGAWSDLSLILLHDDRPCGVWPLSAGVSDGTASITSHGMPVAPPLFVADLPERARKRTVKSCLDLVDALCRPLGIRTWQSGQSFAGEAEPGLGEWHLEAMCRGAVATLRHELFVDLSLDMAAIKSRIRKSYRSLMTSGTKLWQVTVVREANPAVWAEFQMLHRDVAGRVTRGDETWMAQHEMIARGHAFLVVLRNTPGAMVGGGFFQATRDEGLYAVAAYDRSLFSKPLGHVVQCHAIEELKRRGARWYKLGLRQYPGDDLPPSEKELSISEFKQGFSTHVMPRVILRHEIV